MKPWLRTASYLVALALLGAYGVVALRGPQGVRALLTKQQEIRLLQEQNANLVREIEYKRKRIERLRNSPSEQEMEIRRQLKLLRPGETQFIIPDENPKK